ncbi:hypothetical protein GTO91_11520 [Heliobacterium undosum]|uniref:Uncharacterized protein n=1 Tax=Heliomicrobium undosum TaxID=121734 RepID=A0A845L6P8_9FIRM|nr:hypothetical protein [Heliomicrobium undosum]MZP30340.1 hypothetical protein [Heliomicrobium undosum]
MRFYSNHDNDHTKRLTVRIFIALQRYEDGIVEEEDLLRDVEGIVGALEDEKVRQLLSAFALKVDESRLLYDVAEGRKGGGLLSMVCVS